MPEEYTLGIILKMVVRVDQLVKDFIAVPAELSLAESTDHFVASVQLLDRKVALFVWA